MSARRTDTSIVAFALRPIRDFFRLEAASGALLFAAAVVAFAWVNVHAASYDGFVSFPISIGAGDALVSFTLRDAVNDGLMAVFFFVVGMEIKRELATGELSSPSKASLPVIAALGGMIVPAAIFFAFNHGRPSAVGWGIPMATDIAFCMGILSLLRGRVPRAVVVFLTALAIFDDIGGILVIAIFYAGGIQGSFLAIVIALSIAAFALGRAHVANAWVYATLGVLLWYAVHHAGIHATIAGVILGLAIPARARAVARPDSSHARALEDDSEHVAPPVERFIHALHPFVAFLVLPLFALANSGISFEGVEAASLSAPVTLGIAAGLLLGKPIGIYAATWLAIRSGVARMPAGASHGQLIGVSVLAGVGFTVALFIAALAYPGSPQLLNEAKIGVVGASLIAGAAGYVILRRSPKSTDALGANR